MEKVKKVVKSTIVSYKKKTKKISKLKKKKEYELNETRVLIKKQNESNGEIKKRKKKQNREDMVEDIDLGRFFEVATSNKIYVNRVNLHETKNEFFARLHRRF